MKKKLVVGILALLVLVLAGGVYFWWAASHRAPVPAEAVQAVTDIQDTVDSINQRAVQDLYSNSDAAADQAIIPDVNPYRDTNPFTDIKTNPFE